jgi:hypothetical protein
MKISKIKNKKVMLLGSRIIYVGKVLYMDKEYITLDRAETSSDLDGSSETTSIKDGEKVIVNKSDIMSIIILKEE